MLDENNNYFPDEDESQDGGNREGHRLIDDSSLHSNLIGRNSRAVNTATADDVKFGNEVHQEDFEEEN